MQVVQVLHMRVFPPCELNFSTTPDLPRPSFMPLPNPFWQVHEIHMAKCWNDDGLIELSKEWSATSWTCQA